MNRRPIDERAVLQALDIVKSDVTNLTEYFKQGRVGSSEAVLSKVKALKDEVGGFVALFGSSMSSTNSQMADAVDSLRRENQMLKEKLASGGAGELSDAIYTELIGIKTMLAPQKGEAKKRILTSTQDIAPATESEKFMQKQQEVAKMHSVQLEKSMQLISANAEILKNISLQLTGMYQEEKEVISNLEKKLDKASLHEDPSLSKGFKELKEELDGISAIMNIPPLAEEFFIQSEYSGVALEKTAKDLENIVSELEEMEESAFVKSEIQEEQE